MSDQADNLAARLAPYRETPGVIAALLISHDGFIVAADAEAGFDADAVAAQVAGAIDMGSRLAGELGQLGRRARVQPELVDDFNLGLRHYRHRYSCARPRPARR